MEIHVVKSGETVSEIAALYQVSTQRIVSDNGLYPPYSLVPGMALVILKPKVVHIVRDGETLYSIAREYGSSVMKLIRNNPNLSLRAQIYPGELLTVSFEENPQGTLSVNAYAYPHTQRELAEYALPYLSSLTVFGYGFTAEGDLIPAQDDSLVRLAMTYRADPIFLLSSITEDGTFSGEGLRRIVQDPVAQKRLFSNILSVMKAKGYTGIDMDFEFIEPELKEEYLSFLENTAEAMRRFGYTTHVDLAPKVSADQPGLLYESHDYQRIGEIADSVLLMTYEWGYTYGPPMAVAPIRKVGEVLSYGLTEIPAEKIYMGIPNYGYDWKLPFEKGKTKAETVGNLEAVGIAQKNGAEILFDETAQSPYFFYRAADGSQHEVWFEDARSIEKKLSLALGKKLRGVGYWNLLRSFPQNWAVLNSLVNIKKRLP